MRKKGGFTVDEYIVAYLDMLGTTDMIRSESSETARSNLSEIYQRAHAFGGNQEHGRIEIKIFSDNLVFAQRLDGQGQKYIIKNFVQVIAEFQFEALHDYNWLLRGGITIGSLHLDDVMVWGEALVRSYELESRIAIFPRIVIDPNPEVLTRLIDADIHKRSWLRRDNDGQYFLHYLYGRWGFRDLSQDLSASFDCIVAQAGAADGVIPMKTFQKLSWHKHYVNQFLQTLENPQKYLIFPEQ